MAEEIFLTQVNYSKATFDNGILSIELRTGGIFRHKNVPWAVFDNFRTCGNTDSYYQEHIKNIYPRI